MIREGLSKEINDHDNNLSKKQRRFGMSESPWQLSKRLDERTRIL